MLPLCGLLGITVNELLAGERIAMEDYKAKAEKTLLELREAEERNNRRMLSLEVVLGSLSTVAALVMVFAASFGAEAVGWRVGDYGRRNWRRSENRAGRGLLRMPPLPCPVRAHPTSGGDGPPLGPQPEYAVSPLRGKGLSQKSAHQVTGRPCFGPAKDLLPQGAGPCCAGAS